MRQLRVCCHPYTAGSADGDVRLWDVPARRCLRRLVGHTGQVKGISVTPDGEACVTCSTDCTVKLWKVCGMGWGVWPHGRLTEGAMCWQSAVRPSQAADIPLVVGGTPESSWVTFRCCRAAPMLAAVSVRLSLQVPFAPFDGGPIQEDQEPVLEFSGR